MKMITVFFLSFMVALIGFPSISNATSVGETLTTPEPGWKRYDDSHSAFVYLGENWIKYEGEVSNHTDDVRLYNSTNHYTALGKGGTEVRFSFYGTKLRLISSTGKSLANDISVIIDGVSERVSAKTETTTLKRQQLTYEKTNLPLGNHEVRFISGTNGDWRLEVDAIDIDDTGYLIDPAIGTPVISANVTNEIINVNWSVITGATGYNVKRAVTSGGPYETIAINVTGTTYSDTNVVPGIAYYYVVTAINGDREGAPSNVASATMPIQEDGRAILAVTLTTGLEKEYDLSMQEVNAFINWYEAKQAGSGTATYAINKHDNNKGPFKSRKDYILFDRILTFEVNEY
jgi:hypothetical protein